MKALEWPLGFVESNGSILLHRRPRSGLLAGLWELPRPEVLTKQFGRRCWELDAMDPNDLRARVQAEIVVEIEPAAWQRCDIVNKAEQQSLRTILDQNGCVPTLSRCFF